MNRRTMYIVATACFLVLQLAVIGSVIVKGNLVIANGVECRFKATGYDPNDPLRGRYVQFNAEVETTVIDKALEKEWGDNNKAYFLVSETPDASGFTQVLRCAAEPSDTGVWIGPVRTTFDYSLKWGDKKEGENWEDYEKRRRQSSKSARARLPEKFYVPEKEAPKLEERLRKEGALGVAVYRVYKGSILLTDLQVTP